MEKNNGWPEEFNLLPGEFSAKAIFRGIARVFGCKPVDEPFESESGAEAMLERQMELDYIEGTEY